VFVCGADYVQRYAQPQSIDPRNLEKAANESDGEQDEEMKDGDDDDEDSDDGFLSSSDEEDL
jgi:hypothetical protein